jgi:WD40 repeat protein
VTLLDATVEAALKFGAGEVLTGTVSAPAVTLAQGALQAMFLTKLKVVAVAAMAVGLLSVGAGGLSHQLLAEKQVTEERPGALKPAAPVANQPKPQPAEETQARTDRYGDLLPDGALVRLGTVRLRPGDIMRCVTVAPDGRTVVSAGDRGVLCLWEIATGNALARVTVPGRAVTSVAVSCDGRLVAALTDGAIAVWEPGRTKQVRRVAVAGLAWFAPVAFSPDNRTLAFAKEDNSICLWDVVTEQEVRLLKGHEQKIKYLAFLSDGKSLVSAAADRTCRLWNTVTGQAVRQVTEAAGGECYPALLTDGKTLVYFDKTMQVQRWDLVSGQVSRTRKAVKQYKLGYLACCPDGKLLLGDGGLLDVDTGQIRPLEGWTPHFNYGCPAFSRDGKIMSLGGEFAVRLWDTTTGKKCHAFAGHEIQPHMAFSPDGAVVASANQWERTLRIWDPATGKELQPLARKSGPNLFALLGVSDSDRYGPAALAYAPDGKTLAAGVGSERAAVHLWDTATGQELRSFPAFQPMIVALAFSPDGRVLASGSSDENLRKWDPTTGKEIRPAHSVEYIRLWDPATGKERRRFEGPIGRTKVLAFSRDGTTLACAATSWDGSEAEALGFCVWDLAGGKQRNHFTKNQGPFDALALSPEGTALAAAGRGGTIFLWNVATGEERQRIRNGDWFRVLAFSPDGRQLASAGVSNTISLWELSTGSERCRFTGHHGMIASLAFSPDGKCLASGSLDTTMLVWDLTGQRASGQPPAVHLSQAEMENAWKELAGREAASAHGAITTLTAAGQQAVLFLRQHLHPVAARQPHQLKQIEQLILALDSDRSADRQKASDALAGLRGAAEPALRKALTAKPSLEAHRRVQALLAKLEPVNSPELLREVRAVEVLEHIGTPPARQILKELAKGAPTDRLTQEAKASLERLAKRPVAKD